MRLTHEPQPEPLRASIVVSRQAENDRLGKDLSEGRVQKLRADAALQKEYEAELRKALAETREWVEHLTEELDTSQALVLSLRRETNALKAKARS